jgi:chemotaxis protein CheD
MHDVMAEERRITVLQGEHSIADDPDVVLTTILGSCVAACIHDPVRRIGGMNHFLLATPGHHREVLRKDAERYGAFAMEMLINALIKRGARRSDLRAHVYGGASMNAGMADIGHANGQVAIDFLERDGIAITRIDLGGSQARRIDFRAALGQARSRLTGMAEIIVAPAKQIDAGDVELF